MLRDLWPLIRAVFKSWWAIIGIANGTISYLTKIVDLKDFEPYIRWGLRGLGVFCIGVSLLRVYHEQQNTIRTLRAALAEQDGERLVIMEGIREEVMDNIHHHLREPHLTRDETWKSLSPKERNKLPAEVRELCYDYYSDLKNLRGIADSPDQRTSTMAKRTEYLKAASSKAFKLHKVLCALTGQV